VKQIVGKYAAEDVVLNTIRYLIDITSVVKRNVIGRVFKALKEVCI
jgi:hypothetical protein